MPEHNMAFVATRKVRQLSRTRRRPLVMLFRILFRAQGAKPAVRGLHMVRRVLPRLFTPKSQN